ncbi:glutamine synthetase [Streptomyces toxytricini]
MSKRSGLGQCRPCEVPAEAPQFLRNKKQEWEECRSKVTAFELRRNLPVL